MNKENIAIMIDSGTDVPAEIIAKNNMFVLPLRIIYAEEEFIDGKDITPKEMYERLDTEIPTTSLPSGEDIISQLQTIKDLGYTKVIAVTISANLSGTFNFIRTLSDEVEGLEVVPIDTKNISIGSGFTAIQAANDINSGKYSFEEIVARANSKIKNNKVFFTVSTLEYLRHGGRIGHVGAAIGNLLNIKPIISCNEEGVYYSVAKVRGRGKSLKKLLECVMDFVPEGKKFSIGLINSNVPEEMEVFAEELKGKLKGITNLYNDTLSTALGVHTGPDLIGVGVQILED